MTSDLILLIFVLAVFAFCGFYIDRIVSKELQCLKGKEHNWKFIGNSKGRTGDLGFGIRGSWNIDTYRCTECGKIKEEEIY